VKRLFFLFITLSLGLSAFGAGSQGKGQGKGYSGAERGEQKSAGGRRFGRDQERGIRNWFSGRDHLEGLPPGLAKREALPPGLRRQIRRQGTLPPGLRERLQPLPRALEDSLEALPAGLKRRVIGVDLILIVEDSQEILDVIQDIF